MPFPAQQPEKEPENPPAVENPDRSQERRSPRQSFRGEDFFLFRRQGLVPVFARLHGAFQICGQEARFSRTRRSIDVCSHQQPNAKSDPGHPSEVRIQHLPEGLLSREGQNYRRTRDPFDNIPWTRRAVIQDEVVPIKSVLREEIELQGFEQRLPLTRREIQREFCDALTVRSNRSNLLCTL